MAGEHPYRCPAGRGTCDAPGKTVARFTKLIAEPAAADNVVAEAVNDTLKAIAASRPMKHGLAPRFEFTPKDAGPIGGRPALAYDGHSPTGVHPSLVNASLPFPQRGMLHGHNVIPFQNTFYSIAFGTQIRPHDADLRFQQREGVPTGVSGALQGAQNASSFVFRIPGSHREWEIWNGIQFVGRSAGGHQIDISIVPREVGVALRAMLDGGLPIGTPSVAIECKDVNDPGSGDEMRAFVARLYDLTILRSHTKVQHLPKSFRAISPCSGPGTEAHGTFWTGNRETFNVIARRTGFVRGAAAMTAYYAIQPHGSVVPGTAADTALTGAIVGWITANLA